MPELTSLKGIGEKTAGAFNRLGIFSAEDLIWFCPRDYEVFEAPRPIYSLAPGKMGTAEGILYKEPVINRYNGKIIVNACISDMTGKLKLSWFNAPFIKNSLKTGIKLVFMGRVYEKNGSLVMNQPKVYDAESYASKYEGKMMPVYPLTKGLTNNMCMKAAAEALTLYGRGSDYLPEGIKEKYGLCSSEIALIRLHFPRNGEELAAARKRMAFNEFFMEMLANAIISSGLKKNPSQYRCRPDLDTIKFMAGLPFELTKAQAKAYKEITYDMNSGRVMNRLLEGDVGSGKTIVAFLAMLNAALNGYQAAMMAPTAVLAQQHYDIFIELIEGAGDVPERVKNINIVLLTGSLPAAEKNKALESIKGHGADIVIGTQALFQEGVEYKDLGLIVADEQHRFGVSQREALFAKGGRPHTLLMSATPIPRTLSMILYSSMDISVIDKRPSGRKPIKNCVVGPGYRKTAYKFIYDQVKMKHQAYIICPAIESGGEEEDEGKPENVTDYAKKLRGIFPADVRTGVLHGRLKADEKESVMRDFKDHRLDVLVSTTVVEVGVDVKNATVMMIENAERYGLAQLHQLRGRVGRGEDQSYCIMINTSESRNAQERLQVVNNSNDGFYIAEADLKTRGPGDMFGTRQSGELNYRFADIYRDSEILKNARNAADGLLEEDPLLELPQHQALRKKLKAYIEKGYIL